MIINLLKEEYKTNSEFYNDFIKNDLRHYEDTYIDYDKSIEILEFIEFPIYLAKSSPKMKKRLFCEMISALDKSCRKLDRNYLFDELFWHSYITIYMRDYLLENYPEIKTSEKVFRNIVLKAFNWENYIYKAVISYQYIHRNIENPKERDRYYSLIIENLDVFNYIIKYEIFRNHNFLINILDIIDETETSKILKARIKGRDELKEDERYGRRVIYEFNKSYPVLLSPMLSKEDLVEYFLKYLFLYYDNDHDTSDVLDAI